MPGADGSTAAGEVSIIATKNDTDPGAATPRTCPQRASWSLIGGVHDVRSPCTLGSDILLEDILSVEATDSVRPNCSTRVSKNHLRKMHISKEITEAHGTSSNTEARM